MQISAFVHGKRDDLSVEFFCLFFILNFYSDC